MNKRIEELALQAGGSHFPTVGGANLEKFAELLITEASRVAREYTLKKSGVSENYDGTVFVEKAIKQHFGLEQ